MRLIDADAMKEDIKAQTQLLKLIFKDDEDGLRLADIMCEGYMAQIDKMPSIEPEQKKGEWIDGMLYYDFEESEWEKVKCSVCKNFVVKQIFYHDNKYHFCPYCGADMRGE